MNVFVKNNTQHRTRPDSNLSALVEKFLKSVTIFGGDMDRS